MLAKEPVFEVVSPVGESTTKVKPLAPSLKTLEGKTICELWNKMFRGEVTFPKIEEVLSERYPGIQFVRYAEFGSTHGPDEKTVARKVHDSPPPDGPVHSPAVSIPVASEMTPFLI